MMNAHQLPLPFGHVGFALRINGTTDIGFEN